MKWTVIYYTVVTVAKFNRQKHREKQNRNPNPTEIQVMDINIHSFATTHKNHILSQNK
jgi:hypothetical protein